MENLTQTDVEGGADSSEASFQGQPLAFWAHEQMRGAAPKVDKWRTAAKDADSFMAGRQYAKADLEKLRKEGRPSAAFNVAQKFIRYIAGIERTGDQEIWFLPRDPLDDNATKAGSLVGKIYTWVLQQCNGDEERSRAFEDMLVRGMGWTDVTFDRSYDPAGEIKLLRVDGHEMLWDVNAQRQNIVDARWVARKKQIPKDVALQRWPKFKPIISANSRGTPSVGGDLPNESTLFNEKVAVPKESSDWRTSQPGMVEVVEFQWYEEVPGYYYLDPTTNKDEWLDEKTFNEVKKQLEEVSAEPLEYDRLLMRHYQRMVMIGKTIVAGPDPMPGKRFSLNCVTGQWDADENVWYGYMRFLMDPQRYLTKFINQVMEIITKQAKGGLFAETDAFQNLVQAEDMYAKTGSITWMNPNGISKIKEKSLPQIPQASIDMFRVCSDMLKEVTGVNPEISMGLGASDQPATTMRQRQTASMSLLATEFAALDQYKKDEARTILMYLPMLADERVIRIGGPFDSESVQLIKDPLVLDYDVVLDDQLRDPNVRDQQMMLVQSLGQTMLRTGQFPPELLDLYPIPVSLRFKLKEVLAQMQEQKRQQESQPPPQAPPKPGDDPAKVQAEIQKLQADALYQQTKAMVMVEQLKSDTQKNQMEAMLKQEANQTQRELNQSQMTKNVIEGIQSQMQSEMQTGAERKRLQNEDEDRQFERVRDARDRDDNERDRQENDRDRRFKQQLEIKRANKPVSPKETRPKAPRK